MSSSIHGSVSVRSNKIIKSPVPSVETKTQICPHTRNMRKTDEEKKNFVEVLKITLFMFISYKKTEDFK